MEKKTIGSFIAALRKAQGMTQQDLAERLSVSNKTVSKWEREESYPDITLIPVIAEIFQVTSDELLKGDRIHKEETIKKQSESKTEKQIKRILDSDLIKFRNTTMIALSLTVIGIIFQFTISYAFYKPVIGFGLLLIFVVSSILLEGIQLNLSGFGMNQNELLIDWGNGLIFNRNKKYRYAIHVLNWNVIAVIFAFPFVLVRSDYATNSVISGDSYLSLTPILIILSAITYFISDQIFKTLTKKEMNQSDSNRLLNIKKSLKLMNLIQGCFAMIFYLNLVILTDVHVGWGTILLPYIIITVAFLIRMKEYRLKLMTLLTGIRNLTYAVMGAFLFTAIKLWMDGRNFTINSKIFFIGLIITITITVTYEWQWSALKSKYKTIDR